MTWLLDEDGYLRLAAEVERSARRRCPAYGGLAKDCQWCPKPPKAPWWERLRMRFNLWRAKRRIARALPTCRLLK